MFPTGVAVGVLVAVGLGVGVGIGVRVGDGVTFTRAGVMEGGGASSLSVVALHAAAAKAMAPIPTTVRCWAYRLIMFGGCLSLRLRGRFDGSSDARCRYG